MPKVDKKVGAALVVGGGIGGMQAALDLADSGIKVYLAENKPSIGGVMAQLDKTFPTNDCAMCTMAPRLVELGRHKDIEIISLSEIEKVAGGAGNFQVTIKKKARYVDEDKCTGCGQCVSSCPVRNQIYLFPEVDKAEIDICSEDAEKVRKIIATHTAEYESVQGALLPILQDINVAYRYLPENLLKYVSRELEIPASMIYRLATFYNAFSLVPKGDNVIRICMGTPCYVKGGANILRAFEGELGIKVGTVTEDLKFGLETVNCLGCCGQSPVVTVGEDIYGYMKQSKVQAVLKNYQ